MNTEQSKQSEHCGHAVGTYIIGIVVTKTTSLLESYIQVYLLESNPILKIIVWLLQGADTNYPKRHLLVFYKSNWNVFDKNRLNLFHTLFSGQFQWDSKDFYINTRPRKLSIIIPRYKSVSVELDLKI